MTYSSEWNSIYSQNLQMTRFPWSDLVSYVYRYVKPTNGMKTLELGCGPGANIPLFKHLNLDYYALEGSEEVVKKIIQSYPELQNKVLAADFTEGLPFEFGFNLIFDRAAITHNDTASITQTIDFIYDCLEEGAYFIGIDWFSTLHSDYKLGKKIDSFTKVDILEGQFKNVGKVHFSNQKHLLKLFNKFRPIVMEHKIISKKIPETSHQFASWNFVFQKI